jgi:hypothetical protein
MEGGGWWDPASFAAAFLLGLPWNYLLFGFEAGVTLASMLPGMLPIWVGIMINQLLLGAVALIWARRATRKSTGRLN